MIPEPGKEKDIMKNKRTGSEKRVAAEDSKGRKGITIPCTDEQYEQIIEVLWNGTYTVRKNRTIAIILQTQANVGLRIGDIMGLRLDDFLLDNGRYRFHLKEQKTGKLRVFTVPTPVYNMLSHYAKAKGIKPDAKLFPMTIRNVQKKLDQVTDYLGYKYIGTHSFRKRFAMAAYNCGVNGIKNDINLVRSLLQHTDTATTIRYLAISEDRVDKVLNKITLLFHTYWKADEDEDDSGYITFEEKCAEMVDLRCRINKEVLDKVNEKCRNDEISLSECVEAALKKHFF